MEQLMEILAGCSLFAQLSPDNLYKVAQLASQRKYVKGMTIYPGEEEFPFLALVASGGFEIIKRSSAGRTMIVNILKSNEFFWGCNFFLSSCSHDENVNLKASEASCIYFWLRDDILPILLQNGKVMWELCCIMAKRIERVGTMLDELTFFSVKKRVARFLIDQAEQIKDDHIPRMLTLEDMAKRIGTTSEVVCRTLYRFSDLGFLQVNQIEVILIDRTKLKQIAEHT
jgi:CRP-like cAMP-binding protein